LNERSLSGSAGQETRLSGPEGHSTREPGQRPAAHWRPYSVNVEVTLACNLRCLHCGSTAGHARREELSTDEWRRVFQELAALDGDEVCLLGGEALVRRDWRELCEAVGEAGLGLVLITNGLLVDHDAAAFLASLPCTRRVGVSLDGDDPKVHDYLRGKPGAHASAWSALERLREAGVETGAITTVSRGNLKELPALRDRFLGADITWQIQCASLGGERFEGDMRLSREEFYEVGAFIAACRSEYRPHELPVAGSHDLGYCSSRFGHVGELSEWPGCGAGLYTLGIESNGDVKGCLSQHHDFVEDSVRRRSLTDIWNDPKLFQRNRAFRKEQLEGLCATCEHGEGCRAGCSNVAYTSTGRLFDNPYCFHRIEQEEEP